ncbi:MAG: ABC transporter permease [Planctomycetes bacterium]|nr:ABC transporter permease [Planctomycetota bacterium]
MTALLLELRSLTRSPFRLIVLLLVIGAGLFVIYEGQRDVQRWEEAIANGQAEQDQALQDVRGYFASGDLGPSDRPWIQMTSPRWQDWYAATRISRAPAPLAGIAFASAESGAVSVRVNRFADPLLAAGMNIENPVLAAAGGLDLVAVLSLLLPLLILALGVEVGGFERYSGLLPLVRVQSGRDHTWLWARCLAVGFIAAAVGLFLVLSAAFGAGADLVSAIPLLALVFIYIALWTALLAVVSVISRHPSHGAVSLGAAWIVFCFLIPAIGVERSAALSSNDFALDLTVDARDAGHDHADADLQELYAIVFKRFPELRNTAPYSLERGRREVNEALRIVHLEERMEGRAKVAKKHSELVTAVSMASPTVAFSRALEEIAGRSPEAAEGFRKAVVDAAASRAERYIRTTWLSTKLGLEDFEELHASTPQFVEPPQPSWLNEFADLVGWTLIFLVLAVLLAKWSPRRS